MSLTGRIIRLESERLGSLQGMYTAKTGIARGLVVYVHGTWGNFYGNELSQAIGEVCTVAGWNYLAPNFPGHDETAMAESIADFSIALEEWVALTGGSQGRLVLVGHSLGALKVLDYLHRRRGGPSVRSAILLAPFDCVAFNQRESGLAASSIDILRRDAQRIVSDEVFPHWLLRQGMLADLIEPNGDWDILPIRLGDIRGELPTDQSVPLWAAIGSQDFAAVPDPQSVVTCLRNSEVFQEVVLVDGAPHNFSGHLKEIQKLLYGWFESVAG